MRGISNTLSAVVLVLIVVGAATAALASISRTREQLEIRAQEALIIPKLEPKIVDYHCFENYAYFLVFMTQDQQMRGSIPYTVEEGSDVLRSGSSSVDITAKGELYFPGPFERGHDYEITVSTNNWVISRGCTGGLNPALAMFLPFDEGSGTMARDETTFDNDATLTGSPSWVTGVTDYALQVDGSSQYGTVSDDADTLRPSSFTLSTWIYREANASDREGIVVKQGSSSGFELSSMSDGTVQFNVSGSSTSTQVSTSVTNQEWTHLTAIFNSTHALLYDGCTLAASAPANFTAASTALYIGKGEAYFNGTVDDVRLYNRALPSDEMSAFCEAESIQAGAYGT